MKLTTLYFYLTGYDVPTLSKNLDWIAVMAYDYHGQWDKKTGHVAPMYARHQDADKTFNVVKYLPINIQEY